MCVVATRAAIGVLCLMFCVWWWRDCEGDGLCDCVGCPAGGCVANDELHFQPWVSFEGFCSCRGEL